MPVNLISDDDLRSALRRYRADPDKFEAAVREKLTTATLRREREPLAGLSPWMKSVAALDPRLRQLRRPASPRSSAT
jgi:hypothetical protein